MKLNKHKGYSFYDVIISLVVLILASVYVTKIFVGAVEVNNKNTVLDACTFEAIETIENLKAIGNFTNYSSNDFLNDFIKVQNVNEIVYSKTFEVTEKQYTEFVTLELIERYEIDKIKEAKVYSTKSISDLSSEKIVNSLYQVTVKIYDENQEEVYYIKTYFTEAHKVVN